MPVVGHKYRVTLAMLLSSRRSDCRRVHLRTVCVARPAPHHAARHHGGVCTVVRAHTAPSMLAPTPHRRLNFRRSPSSSRLQPCNVMLPKGSVSLLALEARNTMTYFQRMLATCGRPTCGSCFHWRAYLLLVQAGRYSCRAAAVYKVSTYKYQKRQPVHHQQPEVIRPVAMTTIPGYHGLHISSRQLQQLF
jgi:hypothetical protein